MLHEYTIQRDLYRLRPVLLEDAGFITGLRTDSERSRFINTTVPDVARQQEWLREYFERPGDYYFLIEHVRTGEREGTLGIYNVDEQRKEGEWGRWIVRRGSKAAVPSACLAFELAFGELGLLGVHSYVAAENRGVLGVLRTLGMRQDAVLPGYLSIGGVAYDAVRLTISRQDWEAER